MSRPSPAGRPRVLVAGFGRLGGAIALGLLREGWTVHAAPASPEGAARAAQHGVPLAGDRELKRAGVCLFVVRDETLQARVASLLPRLSARCALVHCAGALGLQALGTSAAVRRHPRGSFHPLCAVSSPEDSLAGHAVALSATTPRLLSVLGRMARALALRPLRVPEEARAAYHAGAVMSAGGAVALLASAARALGEAGLTEEEAVAALLPLVRSAMRGVEQRGLRAGLTGPVARGDVGVVRAHLAALPEEVARVYRPLVQQMVELVQLPPAVEAELRGLVARGANTRSTPPSPRPSPRGRGRVRRG